MGAQSPIFLAKNFDLSRATGNLECKRIKHYALLYLVLFYHIVIFLSNIFNDVHTFYFLSTAAMTADCSPSRRLSFGMEAGCPRLLDLVR